MYLGQITEYIGLWKDIPEEEFKNIIDGINSIRNKVEKELQSSIG